MTMPTTMPAKRLGMYQVYGPTLEMMIHSMDSGLVPSTWTLCLSCRTIPPLLNSLPTAQFAHRPGKNTQSQRHVHMQKRAHLDMPTDTHKHTIAAPYPWPALFGHPRVVLGSSANPTYLAACPRRNGVICARTGIAGTITIPVDLPHLAVFT
ncbi:unnamed protein product [Protopolystoma xenopodis]|uniref:Uncharacterized protein n=1 Tax=Protopolystoma xenopodis TaxID=117903 RepID=A0A448WCD2_9PLAT|nr:unnamed protein product [Protopolystoma xenopodis]